jgi:DNA-binding Lrp family transcriptional regulator
MDELIDLLKANARTPVGDLAKQLELTEGEVDARIAKLEAEGMILGYQAVVDPEKTANGRVHALIEAKITPERGGGFDRIAARIARFTEVQSCYLISGGYDLLVVVEGGSLQEVARFVSEKLSTIKGVLSTTTRFRLKIYKENGIMLQSEPRPQRLPVAP